MSQFELVLPKMGESVAEATIVKWLKQPGDQIKEDETVVEIATDKVDSEVPSPVSGKLIKYLFKEDQVASVGDVIALIETGDETSSEPIKKQEEIVTHTSPPIPEKAENTVEIEIPGIEHIKDKQTRESVVQNSTSRFYSPLVRSIAVEEGLSNDELEKIHGSGADGRVTKQDILDYINHRSSETSTIEKQKSSIPADPEKGHSSSTIVSGNDEIIEMDRMRKLISEHMMMSLQTAAHVTSFVESDVTNIVNWRDKNKAEFEKKVGEKITYTPIFIQAVAKAIRDFPMINISLNGTQIIKKADINIGLAAALPSGNLIVPVIKKADQLNLVGLTRSVNDLANRSRNNKLQPDEVKDGTFTITNIGSFGNIMGTPVINQPQVAILAIGAIQKKPAVIETEYGDMVGIRQKMYLSLSYDHRIVDGALGGMFLKRISDYLEAWDVNYQI
jgi:2-oxoglutarate dehydrogenase E2 component (dihydrolipoamide succinyltransferase)